MFVMSKSSKPFYLAAMLLAVSAIAPAVASASAPQPPARDVTALWAKRPAGMYDFVTVSYKSGRPVFTRHKATSKDSLSKIVSGSYVKGSWDAKAYAFGDTYDSFLWGASAIKAPAVWPSTTGGSVIVAVLDTGVASHDDLSPQVLPGYDFIDNDTTPTDLNGHGTHVAGTVAATRNNNLGVAGVAPSAKILPVRVLDASGSGSLTGVANGIIYAVDNGAKIINLSLGGTSTTSALEAAVAYAVSKDVLVIAAAGNEGVNSLPSYPAAYPQVLAVASVDKNLAVSGFSSRGSYVDVAGPGGSITSTYLNNSYGTLSGTSMASPHVAAAAALLRSAFPNASAATIKSALENSAYDLAPAGPDTSSGLGLIQADAAFSLLSGTPVTTTTPTTTGPTTTTTPATTAPTTVAPTTTTAPITTVAPVLAAPVSITATQSGLDVMINYAAATGSSPRGFYVKRNGVLVLYTSSTSLRDVGAATRAQTITYEIAANYPTGVSAFVSTQVTTTPPVTTTTVPPTTAPPTTRPTTTSPPTTTPSLPSPQNLRATVLLNDIVLSYAPATRSGLLGYYITRAGMTPKYVTSTTFRDSNAALTSQTITYSVTARYRSGVSAPTTLTLTVAPPATPVVTAASATSRQVRLTLASTTASSFLLIYRGSALVGTYPASGSVVLERQPVGTHQYSVRATSPTGTSGVSSSVSVSVNR